ncbi:hydrolase [Cutibacterium modestum 31N]|nr:hydrolase [Cutibacterium modestum 31N]
MAPQKVAGIVSDIRQALLHTLFCTEEATQ